METYNVYCIFSSICKDSRIFPVRYCNSCRQCPCVRRGKDSCTSLLAGFFRLNFSGPISSMGNEIIVASFAVRTISILKCSFKPHSHFNLKLSYIMFWEQCCLFPSITRYVYNGMKINNMTEGPKTRCFLFLLLDTSRIPLSSDHQNSKCLVKFRY